MVKKTILILTLLIAVGLQAFAQPMGSTDRLSPEVKIATDPVVAGSEVSVAVLMNIQENWHVNANVPTLSYLIGTELTLPEQENFTYSELSYPEPKAYDFAFAGGEELLVYEGESPVFFELMVSEDTPPGDYIIDAVLRAQACDDETCLAPSNIPVSIAFEVVAPGTEVQQTHSDYFDTTDRGTTESFGSIQGESPNDIASIFEERGNIWAFIAIFFIGLALNLTPCVYPMLSVTVSIFGSQTESKTSVVFSKALVYVMGIAFMYSVLGVMAALSGGLFGAWLQSPFVLAGIGILFFLLALSMFGLYELQMPYWLTSKLGTGNTTGYFGLFISGLVVGIFAAPCIGPPIIALLAFVGTQGDPVFGFWAFFILSLGLGLPYLILGTFTGLIQKMPKSGMWMIWVKKVFGVILIGLALFYVGLAFFSAYVLHLIIVTLLIGGVYIGFIEKTGADKKIFKRVKWGTGVIALVVAGMLFLNLQKEGIQWEPYSEERIEYAQQNDKHVIIDFYADWCIPCLELERNTFTDARVIEATDDMVRLKVDLTHFDTPESEELRKRYNIAGVPTIVFLDKNGEEIEEARVVGYLNPDSFLEKIGMVDPMLIVYK